MKVVSFIKREAVLCISMLLAVISAFFVKPDAGYLDYIDFKTLAILFSLMCVMAGLKELGVFKKVAEGMLKSVKGERSIALILVMLCFFFSMLITNDVALITFVPLTFTMLELAGKEIYQKLAIKVVVMQTVAANLGSMLTPVGNPQNLYLYSKSGISLGGFIKLMLPYTLLSLVLILAVVFFATKQDKENKGLKGASDEVERKRVTKALTLTEMFAKTQTKYHSLLIMYIMLFIVAILVVMRVLIYPVMLFITLILVLLADRKTLLKVDYSLLFTFIGFFVFIGNMGRIPAFSGALSKMIVGREMITAVVSSQVISNVPAALLLSGFTEDYKALIVGTDLGGLGTLIASMASLISYKMIAAKEDLSTGKYFALFTIVNVAFLAALLVLYAIIG